MPIGYTPEQLLQLEQQRDRLAQQLAQQLHIEEWVAICQFVPLSWQDWLSLSPLERRAIGLCVEKVARDRQEKQREYENRIRSQIDTLTSRLKFATEPVSRLSEILK